MLPLFRECLLQAGGMAPAASRSSLEAVLSKPGGGEAPILMVGGVPEMMMASKPNEIQLQLSQRKGLVKLSVEVGLTLDPCFVLARRRLTTKVGRSLKSGTGSLVLYEIVLALLWFSSQVFIIFGFLGYC